MANIGLRNAKYNKIDYTTKKYKTLTDSKVPVLGRLIDASLSEERNDTSLFADDKEVEKDYIELDSFVIYMCLEGNFTLVYDVDKTVKVNKGETILVPAILKNLFLIPETEAEILEIYIR